ncbi:MAG: Tex family protein [Lachnospiraceae bacterium]|jgi:uncharacterized protein|nr:Tex family protein [Lachnospiraceae bacterium]
MNIEKKIADELEIELWQVEAVEKLIDEGNTIPFIARYRKEKHGSLTDLQLRNLYTRLTYLRGLEERKDQVISSVSEQGKLTPELEKNIRDAETLVQVEDYYRPYKQKKKTRASIAREKGLLPLAESIIDQNFEGTIEDAASKYISEEKEVSDAETAVQGALDIIAENISDNAEYRQYIRKFTEDEGRIVTHAKDEKLESVYDMYYDFEEAVNTIPGHRILAINRGEAEKFLVVNVEVDADRIKGYLAKQNTKDPEGKGADLIEKAAADSYTRLIGPAIEREIRSELTDRAQDDAIKVFGENLHQLLMQPPIAGKTVLGWDPAFRTGCKLAVVDPTGKVLDTCVIFPTAPQNRVTESERIVEKLIDKYDISLISVGNGTASRESVNIISDMISKLKKPVQYVVVNEAGASVYSASELATEEFPEFDVGQRSAVSIARRLQDPLAELVKIDPESIGVGQYQHDMNQKKLKETLDGVVEDCVNNVGVDLNTASFSLLEHISGISKTVAKNIVAYREANGRFKNRKELLKVPKLGPKAFEQSAGFMRIMDGTDPLDATSVHPESYKAAEELLTLTGLTMDEVKRARASASAGTKSAYVRINDGCNGTEKASGNRGSRRREKRTPSGFVVKNTSSAFGAAIMAALNEESKDRGKHGRNTDGDNNSFALDSNNEKNGGKRDKASSAEAGSELSADNIFASKIKDKAAMAEKLGIGEITLDFIINELSKPARDPRDDMPKPILRSDVMEMKDLKEGMVLKGTVRNVIDFGAFVDIGVHQDGLVHVSQMSDKKFVKHPLDIVHVGDIVDVKVLSVDLKKKRIQLSMII